MGKRQEIIAKCKTEDELRNAIKDMPSTTQRSYLHSWRKTQQNTTKTQQNKTQQNTTKTQQNTTALDLLLEQEKMLLIQLKMVRELINKTKQNTTDTSIHNNICSENKINNEIEQNATEQNKTEQPKFNALAPMSQGEMERYMTDLPSLKQNTTEQNKTDTSIHNNICSENKTINDEIEQNTTQQNTTEHNSNLPDLPDDPILLCQLCDKDADGYDLRCGHPICVSCYKFQCMENTDYDREDGLVYSVCCRVCDHTERLQDIADLC